MMMKTHLITHQNSFFLGLKYKLKLEFPSGYPYTAPNVKFTTPCFHPNVDTHGNICLDILKEKWSALYEVRTILLSIQSLLGKSYFQFIIRRMYHQIFLSNTNLKTVADIQNNNFLTGEPNNDSPLNTHASGLWSNQTAYKKLLLEKYKEATESSKGS